MTLSRLLPLACLLCAASARPALADATLFIGRTNAPTTRTTRGLAIGAGLLIVGVEFEYASTAEDPATAAPSLRTGMGNVYVQTPVEVAHSRFYLTTGAGLYRERLGLTHQETSLGLNTGGGAKISLLGPLKARVDYRVFTLRGAPIASRLQRFYAGVNLSF